MSTEFDWNSGEEITKVIAGKTVAEVITSNENRDLVFVFTDSTKLRIEYDWIYQWELREKE
jgi:hypothetical protein